MKTKKGKGKFCEFHKFPIHNTSEFRAKKSLASKLEASQLDACSNSKPEIENEIYKGKHIIDVEPSVDISTTKNQNIEHKDLEEWERHFHSQMWVKGYPLQFIVDSESQENFISIEVMKQLGLTSTPHP